MKSKSIAFGAALVVASFLNFGAQAAADEIRIVVSSIAAPTTASAVPEIAGPSDKFNLEERVARLFRSPEAKPTLPADGSIDDEADGANIDTFKVAAIPEFAPWAMILAGFVGLGLAGHRRKTHERFLA
jgi:hypothetical protein